MASKVRQLTATANLAKSKGLGGKIPYLIQSWVLSGTASSPYKNDGGAVKSHLEFSKKRMDPSTAFLLGALAFLSARALQDDDDFSLFRCGKYAHTAAVPKKTINNHHQQTPAPAQVHKSTSSDDFTTKAKEKQSAKKALSAHPTKLLNQWHDAGSVDAGDLDWKCASDGTILLKEQRKRLGHVLNVVIDIDGFTEEEEEILFEHAVREMEMVVVKGLPTLMLSRVIRRHGFQDLPDFLEQNIVRLLDKETELPFLSLNDQHRVFRSFAVFIRESMRAGNNADVVLGEIEKLVANVLMRGACVLLEPEQRATLVEKVLEDLSVPVVPGLVQRLVLRKVVDRAALYLEDAFAAGFEAHSKLQAEGGCDGEGGEGGGEGGGAGCCPRLSALIRRQWQHELLRDLEQQIPFISRSLYEGLLVKGLEVIMEELLDDEGLDSAGTLARKLKEEEEAQLHNNTTAASSKAKESMDSAHGNLGSVGLVWKFLRALNPKTWWR